MRHTFPITSSKALGNTIPSSYYRNERKQTNPTAVSALWAALSLLSIKLYHVLILIHLYKCVAAVVYVLAFAPKEVIECVSTFIWHTVAIKSVYGRLAQMQRSQTFRSMQSIRYVHVHTTWYVSVYEPLERMTITVIILLIMMFICNNVRSSRSRSSVVHSFCFHYISFRFISFRVASFYILRLMNFKCSARL